MKRILLIMALVACSGLFAVARGQSPIAPEKVRNIHRLLEITGSHNLAQQMIEQMMSVLKKSMSGANSEVRVKIFNIFEEELRKAFTVERVNAIVIPIYDKYLTGDELIALIAFYETPLGKKVVRALPQILSEASAGGEQLGREVQERALQRITAEVMPATDAPPDSRPAAKRRSARRPRS